MSVFVNGRWSWYRPEWSEEYRAYIDRQRTEGMKLQEIVICKKCHERHVDPHINKCASIRDSKDPTHTPDWGTP